MPTLTRYLLLEMLKVFSLALCVLTLLMLFFAVISELMPRDIGGQQILQMLPFLVPEAARNAAQGATLYAVCAAFGRMAATNELVAIKSLGISPMVMVRPALCLAFLLSLLCVWLYDVGESWGNVGVRRTIIYSAEPIVYSLLRTQRSYTSDQMSLNVKRVDGRRLIKPTLLYRPPNDSQAITITAEEGVIRSNLKEETLTISFINGAAYAGDELTVVFPDSFEQVIPLTAASREKVEWPIKPDTLRNINEEIDKRRKVVAEKKNQVRLAAQKARLPGADRAAAQQALQEERDTLKAEEKKLRYFQAIYHRRFANGFFCLAYAMIGVPVSVLLRSGEALKSFLICFLPIVAVNQPLHNFSIKLAEAGEAPVWWPWFGNIVLMAVGAAFMRRMIRN